MAQRPMVTETYYSYKNRPFEERWLYRLPGPRDGTETPAQVAADFDRRARRFDPDPQSESGA